MVKSELIKIPYTKDNDVIENELHSMGIEPLRWAVVLVEREELLLSVSFEEK